MKIAGIVMTILMMTSTIMPSDFIAIPKTSNSAKKVFESYTAITDSGSKQWELLHGQDTVVRDDGLIMVGDCYTVALGQSFGEIGDKFIFTLQKENGSLKKIKCIMADAKMNHDTMNGQGWLGHDGHMLEFIVDTNKLPEGVKLTGDVGSYEEFEGEIVGVQRKESQNERKTKPKNNQLH